MECLRTISHQCRAVGSLEGDEEAVSGKYLNGEPLSPLDLTITVSFMARELQPIYFSLY